MYEVEITALAEDIERIRLKYRALAAALDERTCRLWVAAEARALGHGGIAAVTRATGILPKRVLAGMQELDRMDEVGLPEGATGEQRIRRAGGGRRAAEEKDETLVLDLERLIDPATRGDPESPLKWTSKSTRRLAEELGRLGHDVSAEKVRKLLPSMGYSLQSNRKTREGASHPDRDVQFRHISRRVVEFQRAQQPVVSVDTKKKELVGDFKNSGREWHPHGQAPEVRVHDFKDPKKGKAIPYGVYDVRRNEGWVSVGVDHDTAEFATASIRQWWLRMGRKAYPRATKLLITADCGGSNGYRTRLWKLCLQKLADELGLCITVCHYPPGTSKWNKIEHRMFCHITANWRGRPLESLEVIVNLIANTQTRKGLTIQADLNVNSYPKGIKISDAEMARLNITPAGFHGEWNYSISPKNQ